VSFAAAVGVACTAAPADPATTMRTSAIWTAVDDELPLLDSWQVAMRRPEPGDCETMVEVHELTGPDERVLAELDRVATDEGWDIEYHVPVAGSAEGTIDGPAAQLVVRRAVGETTLDIAFTVQMDPQYEGRWTLTSIGSCRDTNPDFEPEQILDD
jgi:hypothetical protein